MHMQQISSVFISFYKIWAQDAHVNTTPPDTELHLDSYENRHAKSYGIAGCKGNKWCHQTLRSWKWPGVYQWCSDIWWINVNISLAVSWHWWCKLSAFKCGFIFGDRSKWHSISDIVETFDISWSMVSCVYK